MDRYTCRKSFGSVGPAVLPVIHVLDQDQIDRNVAIALEAGAPGVFLINHDFSHPQFVPLIEQTRNRYPESWIGVNFLGVTGAEAFPVLGELEAKGTFINAYWADDARIDERRPSGQQAEAEDIEAARNASGWNGLYFGGTAFKKQRPVSPQYYETAAGLAAGFMDVVTTSGVATGQAAETGKISDFRRGCGDNALAVASGITPENAAIYCDAVDCFLVATGINFVDDFYNIDSERLKTLIDVTRESGADDDNSK